MIALLLLACSPAKVDIDTPQTVTAHVSVALPDGAVIDPKLDGLPSLPVSVAAQIDPPYTLSWSVTNAAGQSRTLPTDATYTRSPVTTTWDGLDDTGVAFDPGAFAVVATITNPEEGTVASAAAYGWVVRLGVAEVDFVDGPDATEHINLAFHKTDLVNRKVTAIGPDLPEYAVGLGASDLDADDGSPLPAVPVWTNPDFPPWGDAEPDAEARNLPSAYIAGAQPRLRIRPGEVAISARTFGPLPALPEGAPRIRLVSTGDVDADGTWSAGTPITVDALPVDVTLGRSDLTYTWAWEAEGEDGWQRIPGHAGTTHRVYRTLGPAQLRDGREIGAAAPIPWIGTLEDLEPAVEGLPADPDDVLDAVRDFLHFNDWLVYDPGDGDYSGYSGPYIYWDYSWSDLSEWLDRDLGTHLYCHSVSCLLSVLAGTEGVYAPQTVLGVGFTTNLVRAAGTEDWLRWGFNSHSVVSPDEGATIWDASVDMDGDDDPATQPVTPLAPKGLPGDEYLWRLSYDDISIVNQGLCYVY